MTGHSQLEGSDDSIFNQLVERLMMGDAKAAEEVVRDYEPEIRRIVRSRLRDPKLRRVVDSMDICQSVFGRFFVLANLGRFELNSPHDLVKLLTRMATNKVIDKHRTDISQRNLIEQKARDFDQKNGDSDSPGSGMEFQELLDKARGKMSESELVVSTLRSQGLSWVEVSRELNESPQALRKRLERACARIIDDLGIE